MARVALTESLHEIRCCMEERRYDDGAAIARVILDVHPECVQARRVLGEALWENGLLAEAQEAFEAVLEYDPEDFVAYAGLGLIAEQRGSLDEAVSNLRRAVELAPNSEEVRDELLRLYQKTGQADAGRLKISRAALARIYARSEMPARALAEFQAVLHDEPDRLDVRLGLAEALWREGHAIEAKAEAETVLQYLPHSVKAKLILAAALRAEGLDQHAQGFLDQAVAVDPLGEYAQRLFGTDSPIVPSDRPIEVPAYLMGAKAPGAAPEGLDLELPDWLLEQEPEADSSDEVQSEAGPSANSILQYPPAPEVAAPDIAETEAEATTAGVDQGDAWLDSLPPAKRPERRPPLDEEAVQDALAQACVAYEQQGVDAALAIYAPLVDAEAALDEIIQALSDIVAATDSTDAIELLGDAHVRAGHHRVALEVYQRVLQKLDS